MVLLLLLVLVANVPGEPVVLDRIAVIAGKRIIKTSDIEHDIRITDFLNNAPLVIGLRTKRAAAERLVDQTIIRGELASGGYERATDAAAGAMLAEILRTRFDGSDARFGAALSRYGITKDELRAALLWQLTVLKFIDERFRPGVLISDQEVRDYYNNHLAALKKQYPRANSYEALSATIRSLLQGEQINRQFETWLDETRKQTRIQFIQEAFQ